MSKRFSVLFTLMLLFQTITSSLVLPSQINAEGSKQSIITGITVTDEEGNLVDANTPAKSTAYMEVDWSVVGVEVTEGSSESFAVPPEIYIEQDQSGVLAFDDVEIGTYEANVSGIITISLNEAIEEQLNASGSFLLDAVVATHSDENTDTESKVDQGEATTDEEKEVNQDEKNEESSEIDEEEGATEDQKANVEEETEKEADQKTDETQEDIGKEKIDDKSTDAKDKVSTLAEGEKHGFNLVLDQVTDLEGNPFTEDHLLNPKDEFQLRLDWDLEDGHNYVAGDTEIFDLPKGIKIIEDITGELVDSTGQIVATYIITPDKKVELTFTDYVENHSNVKGWMQIISSLDEQEIEVEDGEAILDPIGEEGELRIPIEEGSKEKTIEKKGIPNKGYNADEIHWEVIINKNKTSLINAQVTDVLPDGTEYKEGSLKITKLKVDLYGNILGDLEEVEGIEAVVDAEGNISIPLGDIQDAYRVEYITTVTDDEKKDFTNHATLSDEELEDVSAKSKITINRGEAIKKKVVKNYDPKTRTIEWEIEFNYNEKNLTDVTLKDAWTPEGKLDLVEESLEFIEMEIDENGNAHETGNVGLPEGAKVQNGVDQFEVTGITTDKAYKVRYQTKLKDRVLDPFEVANTAGFGSESDGSGTYVGQFYGSKSAGTIDYAEKTIEWTIKVNQDEYPMENISIEDTLGEGLTLLKDSIVVKVGGESYGDYTLSGDNPFKIDFPEGYTTDKEIIITYKTAFDADKVPDNKPTNKAAITWTPEGENDSITKEVETGTELNKETADYSWKNGSYNPQTKEITWEIITNYRENDIADLIVKDQPKGNQQIMAGSAEVKELNIAADGSYTVGNTVEDAATIDVEANSLVVKLGETNKAYKITYKTSLEGLDDMQNEYVNEAEVLDGDELISNIDAKVGVVKDRKYGDKSGYQDGKQVHWSIDVNLVQQKIKDLKLVDRISNNQEYLEDTITVYHANIDGNGKASKGEEVPSDEYELVVDQDAGKFTVEWKNEVERAFIVEYSTLFFEKHNGVVRNDYAITGDSIEKEDSSAEDGFNVTIKQRGSGGAEGTAGYLVIDKIDVTHGQEVTGLEGAEFALIDADTGKVLKNGITDENGQIDFGRLLFGNYQLKETKVPEGYVTPNEEHTITIDKAYEQGDDKESFAYTVENYQPVFAIELQKEDDLGAIIPGVTFELYDSNDELIDTKTTDENGKISFENLPKADTYYVIETDTPVGYEPNEGKRYVQVGAKDRDPASITVENQRQLINIQGTKKWEDGDNQDGIRPASITVNLLANGEVADSKEVTAANNWSYHFDNLPKYEAGEEIVYTIEEEAVEKYESTIDGFDITNSYTPEETEVSGKKIWDDADNQDGVRPASIIVNLLANGNPVAHQEVKEENNWEYSFEKLPKYKDGVEIVYSVTENTVENYSQQIDGFDITNSYTPEETAVTVTKAWDDANNQDGIRPSEIEVQLTANGEAVGDSIILSAETDWTHTWNGLPLNEKGTPISYSVEELTELPKYEVSINDEDHGNIIITNAYTPEETDVAGEKTWDDGDNQDGIRPASITVNLLANGEAIKSKEVTAADNWSYHFDDLPKYEAGEEIVYTIEEEAVEKYESTIDGFDITNSYTPEETEVIGEKIWDDADNQDGARPETITVNLLADGEVIDTVEVTAADDWSYHFTNLPKYNAGEEIVYTVTENTVSDYTTEIEGTNIINHHTPGQTSVTVTKNWQDENNQDGKRVEVIEVQLTADGEAVGEPVTLSAENNWTYTWADLDEKAAGKTIVYSVEEVTEVPEYETTINDEDHGNIIITNAYTPEETDVAGEKTWNDADNQDGDRPASITVNLLKDGVVVDSKEVTAAENWKYSFLNLPKYQNGKEINYTISEESIDGYEATIDGYDIVNVRVGKTTVEGTKTWLDDNSEDRPAFIVVNLLQNGEVIDSMKVTAETDWKYSFTDLEQYDKNGAAYIYTVEEEAVQGYETSIDGYDISNVRVGKTAVEGTKTWKDNNSVDRPDRIKVNLLQNGVVIATKEVTAETDWKYSFNDLEKYDEAGVAYNYTVKEQAVPGYQSKVDGYDITNTLSDKTAVVVTKGWKDDHAEDRPDAITVNLLQNGKVIDTADVTADNDWTHEFTDLEAYDEDGVAYVYTIEEEAVDGYKTIIDGYDITNVRIGTTSVEGTKTWLDDNSENRPAAIVVNLLQNGEVIDSVEVTAETNWEYAFTELEKYDEDGVAYVYTVEEEAVDGYETIIDGYDITNVRIGTTSVEGTKTWVDDNAKDRPDTIVVDLLQNGEKIQEVEVTATNSWKYSFLGLPKFDENGIAYIYTVEEQAVEGYISTVDGYDITNTLESTSDPKDKNPGDKTPDNKDDEKDPGKDITDTPDHGNKLPKTATDIFNLLALGFGLLIAGFAIQFVYRKKQKTE